MRFATYCLIGLLVFAQANNLDDDDLDDDLMDSATVIDGVVLEETREKVEQIIHGKTETPIDLKHRELPQFTKVEVPSSFIRLANTVNGLPLAHHLRARERILKFGMFYHDSCGYLQRQMKVKPPMDMVMFIFFFVVCSYIPSLLLALIFPGGKPKPTYAPESYRYSAQDI